MCESCANVKRTEICREVRAGGFVSWGEGFGLGLNIMNGEKSSREWWVSGSCRNARLF